MKSSTEARLVFFLLAGTLAYFIPRQGGTAGARLGLVYAIAHEGRLTVDSYHDNREAGTATMDKAFHEGHYYADKAIGVSLVSLAGYLPLLGLMKVTGIELNRYHIAWLLTLFTVVLPSALAGALIFVTCREIARSRASAYIGTLSVFLGTMCWPYGMRLFGHMLAASLLVFGFHLARAARTPFRLGLVLGMALITEYPTALLAVPIGLYFLDRRRHSGPILRPALVCVLGVAIPVAILLLYNTACFGGPFKLGYHFEVVEEFKVGMSRGLLGVGWPRPEVLFYLTLHPMMGIFWHSPGLLLALPGIAVLFRETAWRREALLVSVGFVGFLLFNSGYYMWWGGASFGPRHLIPTLPFLALPLAVAASRWPRASIALTTVSIVQMGIVAITKAGIPDHLPPKIHAVGFFEFHPVWSYCFPLLREGFCERNLGDVLTGIRGPVTALPLGFALLLASAWFLRDSAEKEPQPSPAPTI